MVADWLREVERIDGERHAAADARRAREREALGRTSEWIREQVEPAMRRFATDLRSIGRVVDVSAGEHLCRVEVRRSDALTIEFAAQIGTESPTSTEVFDRFPTMSAVFHGVDRLEVRGDRIYELLKLSYLGKMQASTV